MPAVTVTSLPYMDLSREGAPVVVRRATPGDTSAIVEAWYDHMMPDEPMTAVLTQGAGPERCEALTEHVQHCLDEGVSVVAVDVNTDQVAGFFICHVLQREHHSGPPATLDDLLLQFPRPQAILLDACATMYHPGDVFKAHPAVQRIFDTFYLGTCKPFRGRGIGHLLLQAALVVAKEESCDVAVIFASSDGTRACIKKSGDWQPLVTRAWSEWKQADGSQLFPGIASSCATSHILWLR